MAQRWKSSHKLSSNRIRRRAANDTSSIFSGGSEFSIPLTITPIDENRPTIYPPGKSPNPNKGDGSVTTADSYDYAFRLSTTTNKKTDHDHHHQSTKQENATTTTTTQQQPQSSSRSAAAASVGLVSIAESTTPTNSTSSAGGGGGGTSVSSRGTSTYNGTATTHGTRRRHHGDDRSSHSYASGYTSFQSSMATSMYSEYTNTTFKSAGTVFVDNFIARVKNTERGGGVPAEIVDADDEGDNDDDDDDDDDKQRRRRRGGVGGVVGLLIWILETPVVNRALRTCCRHLARLNPNPTGVSLKRRTYQRFWASVKIFWFLSVLFAFLMVLERKGPQKFIDRKILRRRKKVPKGGGTTTAFVDTTSHVGMKIPVVYENLAEVDHLPFNGDEEIPYFWHIPRTGGTAVNDVLGACLHLTLAGDAGGRHHEGDTELVVNAIGAKNINYINVDTSNPRGIQHAHDLKLAASGLTDALFCSRVYEASSLLFTTENKGRMFTLFRHPVERAVSLFHYTQDTVWSRKDDTSELANISILNYFKGGMGEENWMTRFLTNERTKALTEQDLKVAKEILRKYCLVGLLSKKHESMDRFLRYFGWGVNGEDSQECFDKHMNWAWPLKHRHPEVEEGSDEWKAIAKMNEWDMQLYEYAKLLFRDQGRFFM